MSGSPLPPPEPAEGLTVCLPISGLVPQQVNRLRMALDTKGIRFHEVDGDISVSPSNAEFTTELIRRLEAGQQDGLEFDRERATARWEEIEAQRKLEPVERSEPEYRYDITTNAMTRKAGDKTYAARIVVWFVLCGLLSLGVGLIANIPGVGLPIAAVVVLGFQLRRWGIF